VLVVGDRDLVGGTVGLRRRGDEHERRGLPLEEAVTELVAEAVPPA
jgi:hypothetical protein